MSVTRNTGTHGDASGSQSSIKLVASIGGPATLTRVSIRGIISLEVLNVSLTAGHYATEDLQAGLQYGSIGYGGDPITDGTASSANWISFGEAIPSVSAAVWAAGSSPQNIVQSTFLAIQLDWRGLFPIPIGVDIYFVVGCDTGKSYVSNFETYYSWALESATYP